MKTVRFFAVLGLTLVLGNGTAGDLAAAEAVATQARETYLRYCSTCHPPSVPLRRDRRCAEWRQTVDRMATLREEWVGSGIPTEDRTLIARYLEQEFPRR